MTTDTFDPVNWGYIQLQSTLDSNLWIGVGTFGNPVDSGGKIGGGFRNDHQTFLAFDTSSIPDDDTINSVTFKMTPFIAVGGAGSPWEVRSYAWNLGGEPYGLLLPLTFGTSVEALDWRTSSQLTALPKCAHGSWVDLVETTFTTEGDSSFVNAISKTGLTKLVVVRSGYTSETELGQDSRVSFSSPKLVVDHGSAATTKRKYAGNLIPM